MRTAPAFQDAVLGGAPAASVPSPGDGERFRMEGPGEREGALQELKKFPKGLPEIYDAPQLRGTRIQSAERAEGLE